ncbi:hypothetical protein, partial [Streptomyces sulfonofaciens]|uniref:hypothetical protein n=1 Tax=Streptomyces sulfonofaciens TaxID=68272 RepID=UPI003570C6E6
MLVILLTAPASITGLGFGAILAKDPRTRCRRPQEWTDIPWATSGATHRDFDAAPAAVSALLEAGGPACWPAPTPHISAHRKSHGISFHGELQLLVEPGVTPQRAPRLRDRPPRSDVRSDGPG